jgi:hypothetical protein
MVGIMIACMTLLPAAAALSQDGFVDHGVGAPVAENRGVITTADSEGTPLLVGFSLDQSARGWMLLLDVETGEVTQRYYPEGVPNSPPFASLLSKNGRVYTFAGPTFLEFDLDQRDWTFHGVPPAPISCVTGSSMVDGIDGRIYSGVYPSTHLVSYDPETQEMLDHGQLDPAEKYVSYLVCDSAGWLYAGIGTARQNIVACNPATSEIVQLAPEADRVLGSGWVVLGVDGKAYGRVNKTYYRMFEGRAEPIEKADMPATQATGAIGWGNARGSFPDGRKLVRYSLPDKWADIQSAEGEVTRIEFDYESGGASITSLAEGPDGIVYCSTCHPMHFLALDTNAMSLTDMGAVPAVGGGNFCAIASQGDQVIGAQYSAGRLWAYDVNQPWNPTVAKRENLAVSAKQLVASGSFANGHFTYLDSHDVAFLNGDDFGSEGSFKLTAPADGQYYLYVAPYQSSSYCTVQFLFDGEEIWDPYVATNATTQPGSLLEFGPVDLTAGEHTLTVRSLPTEGQKPWFAICSAELTTDKRDTLTLEDPANPRVLAQWKSDICRPRTALAHPDGKHVMMAGFAGYGLCGGGIGIYNLETREEQLLTADEELLAGHSTITLKALPNGDLVGGTSVSAPGGGHATATEGELYILDWESKRIVFHTVPVPGDGNIVSIQVASDGLIYGLSGNSTFFVFDPASREIVDSENFGEYGGVPRHALQLGPNGSLYAMMSKAILRITPGTFEHEKLADSPVGISAGGALLNGLLVFASNAHVWTYDLGLD